MADREVEYLSLDDVLALHDLIMELTDEPSAPPRSVDLLLGAMARPQQFVHYEGADLVRQTAILMVAIAQAQAFVSGNKRTAMLAALSFLDRNGLVFIGERELLGVLLEECPNIHPQTRAIAGIEAWIRRRSWPLALVQMGMYDFPVEDDDPW